MLMYDFSTVYCIIFLKLSLLEIIHCVIFIQIRARNIAGSSSFSEKKVVAGKIADI